MLQIVVPISPEGWDEEKEEFVEPRCQTLHLEHSLSSLSKWEQKHHKAFVTSREKTDDEVIDYVRCMTLDENIDDYVYTKLSSQNIKEINDYINNPMTATTFRNQSSGHNKEIITAEIVYYNMIALQIPFECQYWHLNTLLTLIRVCDVKNKPAKKMSASEINSRNAAINAANRKKYNSKG